MKVHPGPELPLPGIPECRPHARHCTSIATQPADLTSASPAALTRLGAGCIIDGMKRLFVVGALLIASWLGWSALRDNDQDTRLIYDRFWVDHLPRAEKEQFQALFVSGESPVGSFSVRTGWTGRWEGFHYHVVPRADGVLDLLFPESKEIERVTFRARRCSDDGFDYCLDVSGSSRGARRYFSRKEWQSRSDSAAEARRLLGMAEVDR